MKLDDYQRITKKLDALKREQAQAEGAMKQALQRFKKEFGVESLAEARKLLLKKKQDLEKIKSLYEKRGTAFTEKWQDFLDKHSQES